MKFWLLRPVDSDPLWEPWYDKAFGFIICAESEEQARNLAQGDGGDEIGWIENPRPAWTDRSHSTCEVLDISNYDTPSILMRDFMSA